MECYHCIIEKNSERERQVGIYPSYKGGKEQMQAPSAAPSFHYSFSPLSFGSTTPREQLSEPNGMSYKGEGMHQCASNGCEATVSEGAHILLHTHAPTPPHSATGPSGVVL